MHIETYFATEKAKRTTVSTSTTYNKKKQIENNLKLWEVWGGQRAQRSSFRVIVSRLSLGDVVEVGVCKKEVEDKKTKVRENGIAGRSENAHQTWMTCGWRWKFYASTLVTPWAMRCMWTKWNANEKESRVRCSVYKNHLNDPTTSKTTCTSWTTWQTYWKNNPKQHDHEKKRSAFDKQIFTPLEPTFGRSNIILKKKKTHRDIPSQPRN